TLGMTAFFLVNAQGIRVVYQLLANVLSGALIPINLFPEAVRKIMMFLPFQYTNYVPAMVWTGGSDIGGFGSSVPEAVMFQGIALVIMMVVSEMFYRLSIRRFTAVGA
nr:ABC-2 family transporter protein [Lachnospiraceae bacterium]